MFWHVAFGVYFLAGLGVALFDKRTDPTSTKKEFVVMAPLELPLLAVFTAMLGWEWLSLKLKGAH